MIIMIHLGIGVHLDVMETIGLRLIVCQQTQMIMKPLITATYIDVDCIAFALIGKDFGL